MFIRYFARTDDTALGRSASAYCDVLVATGTPVRLVPTLVAELQLDVRGRNHSAHWDRHRKLLITPMAGSYVNVVCGAPSDWAKVHTPGVRNILFLTEQNVILGATADELTAAIDLYDASYVPSKALADAVEAITGHRPYDVNGAGLIGDLA